MRCWRAFATLALLAVPVLAGSPAVTVHNRTGLNLNLRRPSGGSDLPLLIHAASDGEGSPGVQLWSAHPNRSPEAEGPLDYLFKAGDSITLEFANGPRHQETELVFWHESGGERGVTFKGLLNYAVLEGTSGHCHGVLALPQGPTPRTRNLPQNQGIRVISETELELH